jgi:hypothetical protein
MLLPPVALGALGLIVGQLSRPAGPKDALASLADPRALPEFDAGFWYQEARLQTPTWQQALNICLEIGPGYPNCEAPLAVEKLRATEQLARELEARISSAEMELDILEDLAARTPEVAPDVVDGWKAERKRIQSGGAA